MCIIVISVQSVISWAHIAGTILKTVSLFYRYLFLIWPAMQATVQASSEERPCSNKPTFAKTMPAALSDFFLTSLWFSILNAIVQCWWQYL